MVLLLGFSSSWTSERKNLSMDELEARVRALFRRLPTSIVSEITLGGLRYQPEKRQVWIEALHRQVHGAHPNEGLGYSTR